MSQKSIFCFKKDLRLADNVALSQALKESDEVLLVYVHAPKPRLGEASSWWLHHSLISLSEEIEKLGSKLIIQEGDGALEKLKKETGLEKIYLNDESLMLNPKEIKNKAGQPYKVFTPFYKSQLAVLDELPKALAVPKNLKAFKAKIPSLKISDLKLEPESVKRAEIDWTKELSRNWSPGVEGANKHLKAFVKEAASGYSSDRDIPSARGTSLVSPHLAFGEISPRSIWNYLVEKIGFKKAEPYLRQLVWREFAYYLLYHFPDTKTQPLNPKFKKFPWHKVQKKDKLLRAWQKGQTGYPIVDAGMRELWARGWMHNRVRMIVGSFLVKDLLINWTEGADWFWDTLVDADLANNTMGWQWIAGCGADAAPYFRIFNPVLQGEKFDSQGDYVRKWIPEIKELPNKWIQKPFEAPKETLEKAGIKLGLDYPAPVIDHKFARERALEIYKKLK